MEHSHVEKKDPRKRHRLIWKLLYPVMRLIAWICLGYWAAPSRTEGPFLLVSNHVTDWDPILVGCSFRTQQFYFVTSEHLLRNKLFGRFLIWAQDPIPRQKGGSAAGTVLAVMRRLRAGDSVAIFPEGNRTWDGVTRPMLPSIGKLARASGVKLVTYRMEGGYFTSPRWAGGAIHRGKMRGRVVKVYSPETLKAMTPEEINEVIRRDLYEDAYARQRKEPIVYRSYRRAEHIERLLFLCPKCGEMHTLQSKGDTVRCRKCGLAFRYLPTGFLAGNGLPFDNLRDLNRLQDEQVARLCQSADPARPIFSDSDMRTDEVDFSRGTKPIGRGELKLYRDRLELPGVTVPLTELTGMSLVGPQDLYVGSGEHSYLVRSDHIRCLVKYLTACSCLNPETTYGV